MLLGFTVVILVLLLWVLVLQTLLNRLFSFFSSDSNGKSLIAKLAINLMIGLSVWGALILFEDAPWFQDIEEASLDLGRLIVGQEIPTTKEKFVFLDIDEQTHQLWGDLFVSRNKITELIDFAVKGGARLVIVDIDLSQKTSSRKNDFDGLRPFLWKSRRESFESTPYDQELYDYIADYQKNHCQTDKKCPPIILKRVFRPLQNTIAQPDDKIFPDWFGDDPVPIREPQPSFLDKAVAESAPYVQFSAPLLVRSSHDNVIRHGWLWQPICIEKQPEVIPSIQLLAAALIRHQTPQKALDSINNALAPFKKLEYCHDSFMPQSVSFKSLKIADDLEIPEGIGGIRQRIRYNMPWLPHQNQAEKWVRYFLPDYDKVTQQRGVILTVFSAQPYLKSPKAGEDLKDKIVLIGSSYSGTEMPITPLGRMPSGLILLNGIHSLLQSGKMSPSADWYPLAGLVVIILLVTILFVLFDQSFWAVVVSGIVIVILLLPVSALVFEKAIWIQLAFSLLAVYLYQIAAAYHNMATELNLRKQELVKEIKPSLAKKLGSKKFSKEREQLLIKQIEDILEDNLHKTMAQADKMAETLPGKVPPFKTTPKEDIPQKTNKPTRNETSHPVSDEVSEQQPTKPAVDETVAPVSDDTTEPVPTKTDFANQLAVAQMSLNKPDLESATEPEKKKWLRRFLSAWHNRYQRIAKSFSRWPTLARVMTINLVVGLSIALVLQGVSSWLGLMDAEEANMDFLMEINQNFIPPIQKNDVPSTVFLDIDDATHSEWGKPMLIPRRRLKNLIKAAVEDKAKLIMVNIDLTRPTPIDGPALHSDDLALKDYLAEYASDCQKTNQSCPLIILKGSFSTEKSPIPIVRASFLDEVVKNGAPYLRWASTLFEPDEDQVVRWTQLWQSACTNKEQPMVVQSLEFSAMAKIKDNCTTAELQKALQPFQPNNCGNGTAQQNLPETFNFCGLTLNTTESGDINNQRIMYRMSWLVDDKPPNLPYVLTDESNKPVLDIFSALPYAESPPQASLESLTDKIVVIGGSYSDGRDIYSTPLGNMPGTLIIVNALYSLLQQNDSPDLPSPLIDLLLRLLIMAVFIVVISILFVFFRSVWAMLFWGIVVIFGLLPMAMVFLYYGTSLWPYFAVPLVVIFIYLALLSAAWKPDVAQKAADIDK